MQINKCAFVLYAEGSRYIAYKDNLVRDLYRYVPDADILDLDMDQAIKFLTGVPDKHKLYLARLAIPLMEQFSAYDKVIWIDVDVDIKSPDFINILDVETSRCGLAAAADICQNKFLTYMRKRFPDYRKSVYFNAGILVMDLKKIDKADWTRRMRSGIASHLQKPLTWRDQDILNAFFDIKEMDAKFNWIWRRGETSAAPYLVHYTDDGGHRNLDALIASRIPSDRTSPKDRCIVISPRHEFIRPWIRSYFASGNTIPLVIIPGPEGDWRGDDMAYCRAAAEYCGGMVFDCSAEWSRSEGLAERAASKNVGWYSKKAILYAVAKRLSPKEWAWIDDDAEITGNLDECFAYAASVPGFICTQFYCPNNAGKYDKFFNYSLAGEKNFVPRPTKTIGVFDNRHPDRDFNRRMCWNCMVFFHNDANERLMDLNRDFPIEDDECIFGNLYHNDEKWHEGFYDFSSKGWQASFMCLADKPRNWTGKMLHYTGNARRGENKKAWAAKADGIAPAPFERNLKVRLGDKEPVDAVFVIGTGSRNDNEELRYALRNLDKHCKFIRNVYICGYCPPWVDRSKVIHLRWPDRFGHAKDANIIDKLRHACEQNGIAKRILFCSDDQFQTRECTWEDFAPRYLRLYKPDDKWYDGMKRIWHTRLRKTLEHEAQRRRSLGMRTDKIAYYQPHMWMQVDRDGFLDYARWCGYERRDDTIIASGYFNFVNSDGVLDFDHAFLTSKTEKIPDVRHIAYDDASYGVALGRLKELFPDRCRFEIGASAEDVIPASAKVMHEDPVVGSGDDPSPATPSEMSRIMGFISHIRGNPIWSNLLFEMSRAEELRLFRVKGWRTVWFDIMDRWSYVTRNGKDKVAVSAQRSDEASRVVDAYSSNPSSVRTVSFGPAQLLSPRVAMHNRVRESLRSRRK